MPLPFFFEQPHDSMADASAARLDNEIVESIHHMSQRLLRGPARIRQMFPQNRILKQHVMDVVFAVPVADVVNLDALQQQLGNFVLFRPAQLESAIMNDRRERYPSTDISVPYADIGHAGFAFGMDILQPQETGHQTVE